MVRGSTSAWASGSEYSAAMVGVGTTGELTGITTASSTTIHRTFHVVRLSGAMVDPAGLVTRAASLTVRVAGFIRVDLEGAEASIRDRLPAMECMGRTLAPSAASTMEG